MDRLSLRFCVHGVQRRIFPSAGHHSLSKQTPRRRWPHDLDVLGPCLSGLPWYDITIWNQVHLFHMQGGIDRLTDWNLRLRCDGDRAPWRKVRRLPLHQEHFAVTSVSFARADHCGLKMLPPDHPLAYFDFRDALSQDLLSGLVGQSVDQLIARSKACSGVDAAQAAEWLERFIGDIRRVLARRR